MYNKIRYLFLCEITKENGEADAYAELPKEKKYRPGIRAAQVRGVGDRLRSAHVRFACSGGHRADRWHGEGEARAAGQSVLPEPAGGLSLRAFLRCEDEYSHRQHPHGFGLRRQPASERGRRDGAVWFQPDALALRQRERRHPLRVAGPFQRVLRRSRSFCLRFLHYTGAAHLSGGLPLRCGGLRDVQFFSAGGAEGAGGGGAQLCPEKDEFTRVQQL